MTGFVLLRVRAHRLLLAAALLAVVLTTAVLSALAAFSGSVGDAALRHTLGTREAASTAVVVGARTPRERGAADEAVARGARAVFGGLPVTVRSLERSGAYALPRSLQSPEARKGEPDLTHLAAVDPGRVTAVAGRLPGPVAGGRPVPVAVPEPAAELLGVAPGAVLTLTDRLGDKPLRVEITGVYRVADPADPYWRLDPLGGRGVRTAVFTTYGPLLADPAVLASGRTSAGETGWLARADFRDVTTDRIGALHTSATEEAEALGKEPALGGSATVTTGLPTVLAQSERALLVARSTLLIVAVQLVVLAGYTLLLVARLLSSERAGETGLLRARGASRGRIAALALAEALLLALPAAVAAPLLAGPLTRLLAAHSVLGDSGLRLGEPPLADVWLVALAVAVCCAAAVVAPALSAGSAGEGGVLRRARGRALPGAVRAGGDLALLAIAGVAFWQLDRQTGASGGGALSGDREGDLGVDPLLVAAPALALLAGTVLTLRLLPPVARLAERRAARGRGLATALAGWQLSRRPLRGAGPVLLLVLAVAMGMLAIGQSASWDRSQQDQADFRSGSSVRVVDTGPGGPGDAGRYGALPGVRAAAPAVRAPVNLSGNRTATVLALDTAGAGEHLLMRGDLADRAPADVLASLRPKGAARPGLPLPQDARSAVLDLRITAEGAPRGASPAGIRATVVAVFEDRYGIAHRMSAGTVPVDGRTHTVTLALDATAAGDRGAPAGPLALTGLRLLDTAAPEAAERHRLTVERVRAAGAGGTGAPRPVAVPGGLAWTGVYTESMGVEAAGEPVRLRSGPRGAAPLSVAYDIRPAPAGTDQWGFAAAAPDFAVEVAAARPRAAREIPAVATDAFLAASGAVRGESVDVTFGGQDLRVTVVDTVRRLPTTGATAADGAEEPARDGGALLIDFRTVNEVLSRSGAGSLTPSEWWLHTAPGEAGKVAAALRAGAEPDGARVLVRDEDAAELLDDPLGAGPRAALVAVAAVAAALAAVGFAVSAAGSLRERSAEFAVLRALGTPRRRLARLVAAEQGVLLTLALLVGVGLGTLLTRAVVPLIVLTGRATQPVPPVLVELPLARVALLLTAVAALPLLTVTALALRRADPTVTLRHQGDT